MMAVLWDDIAADVASMKRHLGQAVAIHRDRMAETPDYIHAMAFQHAMQAGYTAFEAFLDQHGGRPFPRRGGLGLAPVLIPTSRRR